MKRAILLFTAAIAAGALSTSALAQWTEGFETYDLGTDPVGQGGWLMWGNTAGHPTSSPNAEITDVEFLGGAQSVKVNGAGGGTISCVCTTSPRQACGHTPPMCSFLRPLRAG